MTAIDDSLPIVKGKKILKYRRRKGDNDTLDESSWYVPKQRKQPKAVKAKRQPYQGGGLSACGHGMYA